MGAVPVSETGSANAVNTLLRSIGSSLASATCGVIVSQMTIDFAGHAVPSENSFKVIMAIGCGAALLALFLASFLPRQRGGGATAHGAPAETAVAGQKA